MNKKSIITTGNTKLLKDGIGAISMPAGLTCPMAGECKKYCYASCGTAHFKAVKEHRLNNLNRYNQDAAAFEADLSEELSRCKVSIIRWHDSGDIQSVEYLNMMIRLANKHDKITFYAYTKSISIVRSALSSLPVNLKLIQSYGGIEDHLIDTTYPYARIFDSKDSMLEHYEDCSESDLGAATSAHAIGLIIHGQNKLKFTA